MNRVVVTGLGIVSPLGNKITEYWNNLINGTCGIDLITKFNTQDFVIKVAGEVKQFDPKEYMSKSEIKCCDVFAQYAVVSAMQAYQDSKLSEYKDRERIGVYYGSGIGGINSMESEYDNYLSYGVHGVSPYYVPRIISNSAAGQIAIKCSAKGPCLPIVTACATSSHTIGEAYHAILNGYADAIVAGGADAGITPMMMSGFANSGALSLKQNPGEACLPFDRRRDGFVMSEGAAAIVLENYEIAKKRGSKIYAEMIGYGNTCDAYHMVASDPSAQECSRAIQMSIRQISQLDTEKVYVNAHGTGTPQNDRNETLAIKNAFGQNAYGLSISSTKSITGHMMGAAGAAEAIATILAIENDGIPPTIGLYEKDEACDLNYTPNVYKTKKLDYGLSISMGFGGHNACLAFKKYRIV